jgi:hypothetical protein
MNVLRTIVTLCCSFAGYRQIADRKWPATLWHLVRLITLLALGFERHSQVWGDTHTYTAGWKNNFIDADFYRAVEKLARHPDILRVNPNFYYRAYPDVMLGE